ncbi:hypothetical protein VKT23_017076 [Stygiomarasmius scandens]|uniref:Uncharacterized protein n=1 Tax=Marasmiellus scandens TaxID=2682957 RepID=A0ABR1IW67_9AGAR
MRLEGYEKRYGRGVATVYRPGKQQIDMVNDINSNIKVEIEKQLPPNNTLSGVPGLLIDLGDTQYGLGTLGRRYVDVGS